MSQRFLGLKKISNEPAARMLALANTKLKAKVQGPASASVPDLLVELAAVDAYIDMLRLLSVALPPRERTWWACLAGRDVLGLSPDKVPPTLLAAEDWVRKPSEQARVTLRGALDMVDVDDDTVLCATAAVLADGTLGPGELSHHAAPPGAAQAAVFGMNLMALGKGGNDFASEANRLIDRALDIARGGNGSSSAAKGGAE